MRVEPVDPRYVRWEENSPIYRVYFWSPAGGPGAWSCDELEIHDAEDVREVIAWADADASSRAYTLHAVVRRGDELGLVLLAGTDPTRND